MSGNCADGDAWIVLFHPFDRSIGIISTAMPALLLIPADFGLVWNVLQPGSEGRLNSQLRAQAAVTIRT